MKTVKDLKTVTSNVKSARRSRPVRQRRAAAPGALLGAAVVPPAGQAAQARPEGPLRLRPEPRRHRRALVRLDHARRQRQPHAGRGPELRRPRRRAVHARRRRRASSAARSSATRSGTSTRSGRSTRSSSTTWARSRTTCTSRREQAALVGQEGKPESYYFPPQHNNVGNNFPYTFMGLEPGTTKAQVRKCLEDWNKGDNGILDLSQAYRLKPGTGWLIRPCDPARPGLALHLRAAVGQRRVRHVPVARRRPRGAVGAAGEGHAQGEAPGPRLHRRAARLGSERRPALQGEPLPRADRRTPAREKDGYVDKWIVYGKVHGEQLFTAKELTVNPGQKVDDQGQRRQQHHLRAGRRPDQQAAAEQPEDDRLLRADRGRGVRHRSGRQGGRDVREHERHRAAGRARATSARR